MDKKLLMSELNGLREISIFDISFLGRGQA
jgi:hypothetical protein